MRRVGNTILIPRPSGYEYEIDLDWKPADWWAIHMVSKTWWTTQMAEDLQRLAGAQA